MFQIVRRHGRLMLAASLLAAVACATPSVAETASTTASTPPAATKTVTPKAGAKSGVEAYLARLHKQLMITPDQQKLWDDYANVERDKVKSFQALAEERKANAANMTAVDDLQSYAKFTEANADAVKKLVPAFEALYNSMSDAQKKNADTIFAQFEHRPHHHHSSKSAK